VSFEPPAPSITEPAPYRRLAKNRGPAVAFIMSDGKVVGRIEVGEEKTVPAHCYLLSKDKESVIGWLEEV
jgi:hypothetical protein